GCISVTERLPLRLPLCTYTQHFRYAIEPAAAASSAFSAGPGQVRWPRGTSVEPSCRRKRRYCHAESSAMHAPESRKTTASASDRDRKSTRLNSSHVKSSYGVVCMKK